MRGRRPVTPATRVWSAVVTHASEAIVTRGLRYSAIVSFCLTCILCISFNTIIARAGTLQHLAATHLGADQGVFVEAEDGTILSRSWMPARFILPR